MARITKNKLRELRIFNPHNLATNAGSKLFICYTPAESGRMAHYQEWTVVGIDFEVNPNSAWYNHGNKSFIIDCRENKIHELNNAIQWCFDKYEIPKDQWEKDPYGGWQIKGTIKKALANSKDS